MSATTTTTLTPRVPALALLHVLDALGKTDAIHSQAHIVLHALRCGHGLGTAFALARRVEVLIALICDPAWSQLAAWRARANNPLARLDAELIIVAAVAHVPLRGQHLVVRDVLALIRDASAGTSLPFAPDAQFGMRDTY